MNNEKVWFAFVDFIDVKNVNYLYVQKKSTKFVSNKSILRLNAYELNCDSRYMLLFYIV